MAGKRGRGRPAKTQAEKDRSAEAKAIQKDQSIADTAMAKMPQEKEKRLAYFQEGEALKAKAQGAAGEIGQHKKRGEEVFGYTKAAMQIRGILSKLKDGEYHATCAQVGIFMKDMARPFQLDMFNAKPGTGSVDDSSLFDKTTTGKRQGGGSAPPAASGGEPNGGAPPAKDNGTISLADFKEKLDANKHLAPDPSLPPGVLKMGDGSFKARPSLGGKKVNLGTFATLDEAKAAIEAEREKQGLPPTSAPSGTRGMGPAALH